MDRHIALSTGFGEVMAPQTLVTALIVSPDGFVKLDAGALHSRSELESSVEFVKQREAVLKGATWWAVWVAVELDADQKPVRYRGMAVSELLIDAQAHKGYKSLVDHVNRMGEAMRGGANLSTLKREFRPAIAEQLKTLDRAVWERSEPSLKQALEV